MPRSGTFALGRGAAVMVVAALACGAGPAVSPIDVPEPANLYTGPQRGYTPATLKGATVIDLAALESLLARETERPVLLDVALADRKPEGLPAATAWLPTHRSIPGAIWLPGAGAAPLTAVQEEAFFKRIDALTGGDHSRQIVTFCRPECWGSWNAGKRLVQAGYSQIYWFPTGIEGWQDAHETVVLKPDPAWTSMANDGPAGATGETQR